MRFDDSRTVSSLYPSCSSDAEEDLASALSRTASCGSLEIDDDELQGDYPNCCVSSDELDQLSSCLSEASSDSREVSTSLFYDVVQAQLALWTCVFSLLYSYAWRQHRKKFIMSIFFIIPTVFTVCCVISCLLTTIVVLGRLFSTPFQYHDFLNVKDRLLPNENSGASSPTRRRTLSGTSTVSWQSEQPEILPRPLCRRHSSSNGSINGSRPPSRKLSYCYSHFSAENIDRNEE